MILVLDNYDSFTWNLVQLLGDLGADPVVIRNDGRTVDEIEAMSPERIVISPGPCTPSEAGISVDLIRRMGSTTPMLGVCLGHQAIGEAFGGRTIRARRVMHGKVGAVHHSGQGLFRDLPSPMKAMRYHSLVTDESILPTSLEVVAWSVEESGREVQAMRHREHPVWGVQFHPESYFCQSGRELIRNFLQDPA